MCELRSKLNAETGLVRWSELERHFARGDVLEVSEALNLLDVALAIAEDQERQVAAWLASGEVCPLRDTTARQWMQTEVDIWAVVVKPWVVAQQRK